MSRPMKKKAKKVTKKVKRQRAPKKGPPSSLVTMFVGRGYATEKNLWKRIAPRLRINNAIAVRIETTTIPGFPDAIWFPPLLGPCLIELKAGPLTFREPQKLFITQLARLGHPVFVIHQISPGGPITVYDSRNTFSWKGNNRGLPFEEWAELYLPKPFEDVYKTGHMEERK